MKRERARPCVMRRGPEHRPWPIPEGCAARGRLLGGCGAAVEGADTTNKREDEPIGTTTSSITAPTEDGLADAYSTFLGVFAPPQGNFDSQFPIGYGFHEGLVTEKVAGPDGSPARGSAVLDMNRGTVNATLNGVPTNGNSTCGSSRTSPAARSLPRPPTRCSRSGPSRAPARAVPSRPRSARASSSISTSSW